MKKKIILAVLLLGTALSLTACGSPTKSVTLRDSNQVVVKLPDQVRVFCDRGNLVYAKDNGGLYVIPNSVNCSAEKLITPTPVATPQP